MGATIMSPPMFTVSFTTFILAEVLRSCNGDPNQSIGNCILYCHSQRASPVNVNLDWALPNSYRRIVWNERSPVWQRDMI